jgi:pimeloyl-ACP methyl ester carboxylesterase
VTLFHRDFGTQGKPPLVLLHGLLGSSRNWQSAGRDLAAAYHVFAPDLPNHGSSPHFADAGYELMMAEFLRWVDAQGLKRFVLLGHSMGGKLAMLIACRHPELIERLIIVDIAPKDYLALSHRTNLIAMKELRLDTLRSRAEAELHLEARVPDWGTRKFLATNLECDESNHWHWTINLDALIKDFPAIEADSLVPADHFSGPALFIAGGRSHYLEAGDWPAVESHFPNATLEVIPDSGHNPHMDTREAFVKLILPH